MAKDTENSENKDIGPETEPAPEEVSDAGDSAGEDEIEGEGGQAAGSSLPLPDESKAGQPGAEDKISVKKTSPGKDAQPNTRAGLGFKLLAVLALLAAAGVLVVVAWQWRLQQDTRDADLQGQLARQGDLLADLERTIRQQRETQVAMSANLERLEADVGNRLASYGERLRQLSATTREDWLLAEAEYLLRLANQRLLTERQTVNAIALMESADAILRELNDVDLFPVRKALADDITALRMAGTVDREGLYLELAALSKAVGELSPLLLPETRGDEWPEPAEYVADGSRTWYGRLAANARAALGELANLVRIERRDIPLEPMLSPGQEVNLRQNLRLVLEQAQLALLREEQQVYEASLGKAESWIESHFIQDPAAEGLLGQLAELKTARVAQPLPSTSASLKALQDYISLWHQAAGEAPAGMASPATEDTVGSDSQ